MVKQWVRIPVVANGGIFSVADARQCLAVSGADGIMAARGAVTRPWLLADIARDLFGRDILRQTPAPCEVFLRFCALLQEHVPQEDHLRRLLRFTAYFGDNYHFGLHLKTAVLNSRSMAEAMERAGLFFGRNDLKWPAVLKWPGMLWQDNVQENRSGA